MLPGSLRKVRGLGVDAVSCQAGPQAEEKNSPFEKNSPSLPKYRTVGISMLQGQQMKPVGTQCFNAHLIYSIRSMVAKCIMKVIQGKSKLYSQDIHD
jgi:hypothetical protein